MAHLPGHFNSRTLTQPNEIAFMHTTHGIPGHTAHSVDHTRNSWAYCHNHATITCTLYSEIAQIWCDFCTCADLHIQRMHVHLTLFPSTNMANSKGKLLFTPVPIVSEKESLLVNECSHRLASYGLTLWVVSMNQTPKNCNLPWACHVEIGFSNF